MDFYRLVAKEVKGDLVVYPNFRVGVSKDLLIRGGTFYAIWDEEVGLWSTEPHDVVRIIDADVRKMAKEMGAVPHTLESYDTGVWTKFLKYCKEVGSSPYQLDSKLTFKDDEVKKEDFVSKRLPYSLAPGDCSAWDELVGTLYSHEEREKIEWAIGSVVSGESKKIQKFFVFYGSAGTGKGTILTVIDRLFTGYTSTFDAKSLGSSTGAFATEAFKDNPLVAIQWDGDLSKIEDNTKLNSIISHEEIVINEKFKGTYPLAIQSMLFMGTNSPVRITDAKSGILRRLIDIHPTGNLVHADRYQMLMQKIDFELGAIAQHCLDIYRKLGRNYYEAYRPIEMMVQTDYFYNFVMASYDIFVDQGGVSAEQAWALFKEFCESEKIDSKMPKFKFREELKNYFKAYHQRCKVNGEWVWNWYEGFETSKFVLNEYTEEPVPLLEVSSTESILDKMLADMPAQYASETDTPTRKWANVNTTLSDIDTHHTHYVKVPEHHIVIDFDLKDEKGEKSLEKNLAEAAAWPETYAELSKGGGGVHLHYIYDGDVTKLRADYSPGIEIKTLLGDASLRRRLSRCNNLPVATINSGLPLKEQKKVLSQNSIKSEKGLREMLARNLRKEFHAGTKPSIDFIHHILEEAYKSDLEYDVTDMKSDIIQFALGSTNQSARALEIVTTMKFKSKGPIPESEEDATDQRIVFFDVEVYPNLFVVCWMIDEDDAEVVRMINPSTQDIEPLLQMKLVGFFNRPYDNHILYARHLGYDIESLYRLSQKLINKTPGSTFGEAYGISYADIYDFSSKKQSLKKFQIELGLRHKEMDLPWDEPVPDDRVADVAEYCANDVRTTRSTFHARKQDFIARQILADLSGLTVNHTTQQHTAKILFGDDRNPQAQFKYTHLAEEFPGYYYSFGKSYYRDEVTGEGGYVYAEPGVYENVALLDVASMHPTSIECLELFGKEYTRNFSDLKSARMAIKHKHFDAARKMLGGKLAPYLKDEQDAEALSYALKIVINIVYGLTSAKFDNKFRDKRNKDNIVAKRGALFMIDLKHFVQERGFKVAHIKTDSIKIPNATEEIIRDVMLFGEKYGYTFEHEATYDKFCLVNDAVYVARKGDKYDAVGAQFQHPVVYKTLFSKEDISFDDQCETKQVAKGAMYLDFESVDKPMALSDGDMRFVGKTGRFCPVIPGAGGALLYRFHEGKFYAVTGTKGYFWKEASTVTDESEIDTSYFQKLIDTAIKTIEKFGSFEEFIA